LNIYQYVESILKEKIIIKNEKGKWAIIVHVDLIWGLRLGLRAETKIRF